MPVIGDSMMFCHANDYFSPFWEQVVCTKDGIQIFSHMDGEYFGCTNLTDWSKQNTDFSIIKFRKL